MISLFNNEQINFMKKIGLLINFKKPSDKEFTQIEETTSRYLQEKGFDDNYNPTKEGIICEEILDILGAL